MAELHTRIKIKNYVDSKDTRKNVSDGNKITTNDLTEINPSARLVTLVRLFKHHMSRKCVNEQRPNTFDYKSVQEEQEKYLV